MSCNCRNGKHFAEKADKEVENLLFQEPKAEEVEEDILDLIESCTANLSKNAQHEMRLEEHQKICDYLHDLYDRKNRDYGSSVTDTFNKYGLVSFLVRLEDKLNRVRSLTQNGEAKVLDEKIEDTLMDMANYAMLAVIELRMNNK